MGFEQSLSFNEIIDKFIEKYALEKYNNDRLMQIRIIQIKYEGNLNGYSLFNSTTIAKDISEKSVAQIEEKKSELFGVNVVSVPKRYYPNGSFAAHVIGYVSKISDTEYKKKKEEGYDINSVIRKNWYRTIF